MCMYTKRLPGFSGKRSRCTGQMYFATTKAHKVYSEVDYEPSAIFMYRKESAGIPRDISRK